MVLTPSSHRGLGSILCTVHVQTTSSVSQGHHEVSVSTLNARRSFHWAVQFKLGFAFLALFIQAPHSVANRVLFLVQSVQACHAGQARCQRR